MEQGLFHNPQFVKIVNEWAVPAIAHDGSTRNQPHKPKMVRNPRTKKEEEVCPVYEGIACSSHKSIYSEARQGLNFRGTPSNFLIGPDGKMMVNHPDLRSGSPGHYETKIMDAIKRIGKKPIPGSVYWGLLNMVNEGLKVAEERKDFKKAKKLISKAIKKSKKKPQAIRDAVVKGQDKLNELALGVIEEAKEMDNKKKAIKLLKKLAKDLKGYPAAKAAKKALKEISF